LAVVEWIHLIAASVWVGGLVTLGAVVAALRAQDVDRVVLRAVARQFGRVSWAAMGAAVLSGGWMAVDFIGSRALAVKIGLVVLTAGIAAWHQFAARNQSARMRGILQAMILLSSLAVVGAAVALQ
jgi:putative copper export protein